MRSNTIKISYVSHTSMYSIHRTRVDVFPKIISSVVVFGAAGLCRLAQIIVAYSYHACIQHSYHHAFSLPVVHSAFLSMNHVSSIPIMPSAFLSFIQSSFHASSTPTIILHSAFLSCMQPFFYHHAFSLPFSLSAKNKKVVMCPCCFWFFSRLLVAGPCRLAHHSYIHYFSK